MYEYCLRRTYDFARKCPIDVTRILSELHRESGPLLARPKRVAYVTANNSAPSPNWLGAYHWIGSDLTHPSIASWQNRISSDAAFRCQDCSNLLWQRTQRAFQSIGKQVYLFRTEGTKCTLSAFAHGADSWRVAWSRRSNNRNNILKIKYGQTVRRTDCG